MRPYSLSLDMWHASFFSLCVFVSAHLSLLFSAISLFLSLFNSHPPISPIHISIHSFSLSWYFSLSLSVPSLPPPHTDRVTGESVMAVNNRRKQLDELCFVRDLQNSLDGRKAGFSLAVPGRKFVTRGTCTAHHSLKKYDKVQAAVYFIFSDMVMLTSEAVAERYQLISYCMLKDAYIMTIPGDSSGMRLVNVDKKSRETLIFSSPNVGHVVETIQHQILRCAYDHWSFTRLQSNKRTFSPSWSLVECCCGILYLWSRLFSLSWDMQLTVGSWPFV